MYSTDKLKTELPATAVQPCRLIIRRTEARDEPLGPQSYSLCTHTKSQLIIDRLYDMLFPEQQSHRQPEAPSFATPITEKSFAEAFTINVRLIRLGCSLKRVSRCHDKLLDGRGHRHLHASNAIRSNQATFVDLYTLSPFPLSPIRDIMGFWGFGVLGFWGLLDGVVQASWELFRAMVVRSWVVLACFWR